MKGKRVRFARTGVSRLLAQPPPLLPGRGVGLLWAVADACSGIGAAVWTGQISAIDRTGTGFPDDTVRLSVNGDFFFGDMSGMIVIVDAQGRDIGDVPIGRSGAGAPPARTDAFDTGKTQETTVDLLDRSFRPAGALVSQQ